MRAFTRARTNDGAGRSRHPQNLDRCQLLRVSRGDISHLFKGAIENILMNSCLNGYKYRSYPKMLC